ncbi:MAG: class I SAM-dependent methyltransferase [Desulfobacterales bacterium]|nr:class I SAM-dependent methyltransferase [Desulfobacterales bacterium]
MDESKKLKELVIEENVKVHREEASVYEKIHPQLFNWYHNAKSWDDINFLFDLMDSRTDLRVLDLGCGTGFLTTKMLQKQKADIIAVDLSKDMLMQLEKKLSSFPQGRVALINKEATAFLQGDNTRYDLITASAFLHHLTDIKELLDLAIKNLKPNGLFYIAYEPLKQPIDSRLKFALHRFFRTLDVVFFNAYLKMSGLKIGVSYEKSIADYQTTLGGVDPLAIIGHLEGKGEILRFDKFATRAFGIFAFILDKMVESQNTFSIIFRKL